MQDSYVLRSDAEAALAEKGQENGLLMAAMRTMQDQLTDMQAQMEARVAEATAAIQRAQQAEDGANAAIALAQADARGANATAATLQDSLNAERAARAECEARCTALAAELRKPFTLPERKPPAYDVIVKMDGADNLLGFTVVPQK